MAFLNVKNRAISVLTTGITDETLSLTVVDGDKFPASNFHVTIDDEIILCSTRVGNVMTIVRAQEGTVAAAHSAGASVELRITAAVISELQSSISADYVLEDLSAQCDGANKVFTIANVIDKIIWLSLGGGLLIQGLDFNKTGAQEITLIGKYDTSPPDAGEEMYFYYIKS